MKDSPLHFTHREEIVLKTLNRYARPAYAQEIVIMLFNISDSQIDLSPGTIYPLLDRLTRLGLLSRHTIPDSHGHRGGRPKPYYEITEKGVEACHTIDEFRLSFQRWLNEEFQPL